MKAIKWAAAVVASGLFSAVALAEQPPAPPAIPTIEQAHDGHFLFLSDGGRVILIRQGDRANALRLCLGDDDDAQRRIIEFQKLAMSDENGQREKGAYLGVSTAQPPAALRKQLGLTPGMGLMIDVVVPDSPAAKAGLQQYDILQKLDDQLVINPQQLAVLVRWHKAGDEIKLGIIHDGKPQTLSAKLVEHDLEPLADDSQENERSRIFEVMPRPILPPIGPGMSAPENGVGPGAHSAAASMTWLENGHAYSLSLGADGHKTFSERDNDGKVVFDVPIDSREQRHKLTPEQREKLHRLEQHLPSEASKMFQIPDEKPATQPGEKEGEKK